MIGTRAMSGSAAIRFRKVRMASAPIQHAFVHIDVDHLRAVLHLLAGDLDGVSISAVRDHAAESCGTGDVGTLTDVHEGLGS